MKRLLAVLAIAAASAAAQPRPAQAPAAATPARATAPAARPSAIPSYKDLKYPPLRPIQIPNVETFTLPNGMKLFLLEDHELPLIRGTALVRTGNLFDPPEKIGLATITGMTIRTGGTKSTTGEQLDQQLEDVAASVESSIDETSGTVSFSALKRNGDQVLAAFQEVLTAPEFREDKVDLAKSQMRSSIARRNDDAHGIAEREFTNIVYGKDTPYGWQEEYATIDNISRADVRQFYERYFFPSNTLLAVWGDFNTAEMKARLEKLFAGWDAHQPPVPAFPKVKDAAAPGTYLVTKKDVTQTFFSLGHLGGELKDKDLPALEIMSDILGGGFQSRLVQRVRTKMGNAYDISSNWGANYDHPGLFEIAGSTKSHSTVETFKAIQEEVERIRTAEVTDAELETAKQTALNSLVFAFDTRSKTLRRLLTYEYYGYPKDFIQQYQKALAAVTRADVLRVAKRHLDPKKFTMIAVGNPEDFGQQLESLGNPVIPVDLTIPEPKTDAAPADAAGMEKGKRLLARAQQAVGGADKLSAVKDFTETSDFQLDATAGGLRVKETDQWIAPIYFRQDSQIPTGRISAYSDGKEGWIATPQGSGALMGAQLKQVQGDLFRVYFRLLLSDRIPGRKVNAIDDTTVEISDAEQQVVRVVFDAQTGMPQKLLYESVHAAGPPVSVQEALSDFRDVAGMKVPYRTEITQGGQKFADVIVTDYRINSGLKLTDLERRPEKKP